MKNLHFLVKSAAVIVLAYLLSHSLYSQNSGLFKTDDGKYIYSGTAIIVNDNEPGFIWEFARSEAYFLEGLKKWDEKFLNKNITIVFKSMVYVNGSTILKDWEIVQVQEY